MPAPTNLLLDTDIGSDIDDAVCLAYLLAQPACDLLGVTTVSGDTAQRAALVDALCRRAGRADIPIHAGAPGPLLTGPGQPHVPQYEAIRDLPHRDLPPGTAVEFLRQTIRRHPGDVTLLAIGPLTNVALLFAADPEVPSLLKSLVLMCGVFTSAAGHGPAAREWNARVDPIATAIVYRARPPHFISIGLDVTTRCVLPADDVRRRFRAAGGPLDLVAAMAEIWFRDRPRLTFHDPLAAATIFDPTLCTYATGEVRVETLSPALEGLTHFNPNTGAEPHQVAVTVDPDRFFTHVFSTVTPAP